MPIRLICLLPLLAVVPASLAPASSSMAPGHPQSARVDRPVTSIRVSSDGTFDPGFMYWYAPGLFLYPAEFVLLGVVDRVAPPRDTADVVRAYWSGRLDVKAVVRCPENLRRSAAQIRSVECEGFDGLAVGDTILMFMRPYEGEYAVPRWLNTNSLLGYKLPKGPDRELFDPRQFVDLLSHGNAWDLGSLTPDQLRLWGWVDPQGIAEALIREREQRGLRAHD